MTRKMINTMGAERKRGFIYTGGEIYAENVTEKPEKDDFCIAADSGYKTARALGARIDVVIGDFDSLGDVGIPSGIERIDLPAEKDCTDTQAAVQVALERGCTEMYIIGGIGTRIDHVLSNVGILEGLYEGGVHAYITNGKNRIRYIRNDNVLIGRSAYKYLSVIALDPVCKGVSVEGCKYKMKNQKLERKVQFAVSNEIEGNLALVTVKKGAALVIESMD